MMKTIVAIRHVPFEDLGSIAPVLVARGFQISYFDAGIDDPHSAALRDATLLVALGGPISVNDEADFPFLTPHIAAIKYRLDTGLPTLGICLGAQLIAKALGARVYPGRAKEIGWGALDLSSQGENSPLGHLKNIPVLHWHGETFDLPPGAIHLASTPICAHQAFAIGRRALALQFHPEITPERLEQWLIGNVGELTAEGLSIPALRADTARNFEALRSALERCISAWLDQAEL